jgi:hypothetical protein
MARHLRGIDTGQTDRLARAYECVTIDDPWAGASDGIIIAEAESNVMILSHSSTRNHQYHKDNRHTRATNASGSPIWEQQPKHVTLRE